MLNKEVIIVTGGAGLLGKVFCEGIVSNNGIAVVADIDEGRGNEFVEFLNNQYDKESALFCKLDITSKDSIAELIETVKSKYGRVDALVNNAYPRNKSYGRHFYDVEYADFCENVNLHLGGYFLMCQQFAKYFSDVNQGNIINISSIYGVMPPRFEVYEDTEMTMPVEYAVIKSAVIHLTKYTAKYLKGSGVRVNALSPGGILDKQPEKFLESYKSFSLTKGMLDKEDLLGAFLFLLSDNSRYVNGQNIIVDDGFTL